MSSYVLILNLCARAKKYKMQSYYQAYGGGGLPQGAQQQYAIFGGGAATAAGLTMAAAAAANSSGLYHPYFQYSPASLAAAGYSMAQYPQLYQYTAAAAAAGATTTAAATLMTTVAAAGGGLYAGAVAFTPNSIGQAGS
jgi:hypothetical protein